MDRLMHFPLTRIFILVAAFWLTYFGLWDNIKIILLLSTPSTLNSLGSHIEQQELMHHPLIYLAVFSNLLFAASFHSVGLTAQGKLTAGILLFFWQIAVFMRLIYEFFDLASLSWLQEVVCLFLWGVFCFLFLSRWIKSRPKKLVWVYAFLILGATVQQSSETTLAQILEINNLLYNFGDYVLILALASLLIIMLSTTKNNLFSYNRLNLTTFSFITLSLLFLILKSFPNFFSKFSPNPFSVATGHHWITIFSIGFIYYLTPIIFHKPKIYSSKLMIGHLILAVLGYGLIILSHYFMPEDSQKIFIGRIWDEVYINNIKTPLFNALKQAHLTYYLSTIIHTISTILLIINLGLTIFKSSSIKKTIK